MILRALGLQCLQMRSVTTLYLCVLVKPSVATDELWIGLNDQRNQMLFEWTDRTHVTFTRWQTGEPSHATNHQEDCVLIRGQVGATHRSSEIQMVPLARFCHGHLS